MTIAITRAVPASLNQCELTYHTREPIDVDRARKQHAAYQRALAACGCEVIELPELPDHADSVFVEDTAIVFDECAIVTRPGAESRRGEVASIRTALAEHRELHEIHEPGTLDGGDVLTLGRRVYVGLSTRTNAAAVEQMRGILAPFGYDVIAVDVKGSLHLKSSVTAVADDLIVIDTQTIDPAIFDMRYIEVPAAAANMLRVNNTVLCPTDDAPILARMKAEGLNVQVIDNSELAKAEGGLTCCSLIFE